METETVLIPRTEPAPPGPDLPGQVATLQRKAERHKAAIARLEKTLARTKRQFQEKADVAEELLRGTSVAVTALHRGYPEMALVHLESMLASVRFGTPESRQRALVAAAKRDTTLLTLRAKVKELNAALMWAKGTIRDWHGMNEAPSREPEIWALYQSSPEMQAINRALGE